MMNRQQVEILKNSYPVGTRIVLDSMDDFQAPPRGTHGTIIGVDDMGTIHVNWDNGSSLGLIYGHDAFHKLGNDKFDD